MCFLWFYLMKVQAAEQMFESGSFLLWLDVHGGLIFLVSDKGIWRGWPDKWSGEDVGPGLVDLDPPVKGGFAHLIERIDLLPAIGEPLWKERPYQAECSTFCRDDIGVPNWLVTDSYGRKLELRSDATWHVRVWPAVQKAEWV